MSRCQRECHRFESDILLQKGPVAHLGERCNGIAEVVSSSLIRSTKQLKEKYMSKLSDQIRAALDKKKGITHPDADGAPVAEINNNKRTQPPQGKKPPTRSAGRGR
jgi:hypothetical protein